MTNDQTIDALSQAAFSDLRHYVRKPSIYPQRSVLQFAETLWNVYMCRCGIYANFDAFMAECVRRVSLANMRVGAAK